MVKAGRRSFVNGRLTRPLLLGLALLAVGIVGCGGSEEPTRADVDRIDSTQRFHGTKRAIAAAIENYEEAIRRGDTAGLCRQVLRIGSKRVNRARTRVCIRDLPGEALPGSVGAERLDLVVRRIELMPRRLREVAGIVPAAVPRYQIEWELEGAPPAVALVAQANRKIGGLAAFRLWRLAGKWRIADQALAREIDPPARPRPRHRLFHRHGLLGSLGIATAGRNLDCLGKSEAGLDLFGSVPSPGARNARQAVLRSELVGAEVRRLLRAGGSLRRVAVGFGAELGRTFTLRAASGRKVAQIPIGGTRRSGYYIHAISGCPGWIGRVDDRIIGKR